MNFWAFSFLLANLIWGIFWERALLAIFAVYLLVYLVPSYILGFKAKNNFRRRTSIATWDDSGDPVLHARIEIEMAPIEKFLETYNTENPNNKASLTLLFVRAMSLGLAKAKHTFGKKAFGNFVQSHSIDISFLVDVQGENLANALLKNCSQESLASLIQQLRTSVKEYKGGKNENLNKQMNLLRFVPSFVVQLLLRIGGFFSYDFGIYFPLGNLQPNNFGHGIITNIVSFDINDSFAPLVPFLKSIFVATMNTPYLRPVARNGKAEIAKVMNFNLTYDQRFTDVYDLGKIIERMQEVLRNPQLLL
jgi:hypothetical protein